MKSLKHIALLFISLIVLASCGSSKPAIIETKESNSVVTQTIHDTILKIEKDSSSYKALLDCQNGKIIIKQVTQAEPGRSLKSPRVRLEGSALIVDCEAKAQEAVLHYINTHQVDTTTHTIPIKVNEITTWQEIQIWGFRLFSLTLLAFATFIYIKSKV
jgi:hypothetical protein